MFDETQFRGIEISQRRVKQALDEFAAQYPDPNNYDDWLHKPAYRYVLEYNGRQYPPKQILSIVTGISTQDFSGGEETNRVFRDLGFIIFHK